MNEPIEQHIPIISVTLAEVLEAASAAKWSFGVEVPPESVTLENLQAFSQEMLKDNEKLHKAKRQFVIAAAMFCAEQHSEKGE